MEENNTPVTEPERYDGPSKEKMPFGKWIDNFWYHYKWHIIGVLFVLLVVVVCVTQCVGNVSEPVDIHILYAGSEQISKTTDSETGKVPYVELEASIKNLIDDYDENGKRVLNFENYYWLSTEELNKLEEDNKTLPAGERVDVEYHASVVYDSITKINALLSNSDYFVLFISDDLYEYLLTTAGGKDRFLPLDSYVNEGTELNYYKDKSGNADTHAVYLKDLGISSLGTIGTLPDDTLVVLRTPSFFEMSDTGPYEVSCEFLKKILNYK